MDCMSLWKAGDEKIGVMRDFLLTFCIKSSYMKFQLLGNDCIVTLVFAIQKK